MKQFTIEGKVVFQELEGGFWGLLGNDGQQWMPVKMPAGLKKKNLQVRVIALESDDVFSLQMWGTPIRILSYQILP